ncbi:MAG: hypothetical protein ABFD97_19970 [Syntrophobacter sp.]
MEPSRIHFDKIDWEDRSFEIRGFHENTLLQASLTRFGILEPPWVCARHEKYLIVDGFKRLQWARENGAEAADLLLLPEALSTREIWERRIGKKLFEHGPGSAEKVRIAAVLLDLYPAGDIPGHFLSALNLPPRRDVLEKWAHLQLDGAVTLEILGSGEIADRAALETSTWERESRVAILGILRGLRCSASIQVEIVERIYEISLREERPLSELLNDPALREILSDGKVNHRRKTQALRDLLTRLRYPRLSRRQRQCEKNIEELALPHSVRIIPPPAFEGDGWRLELSFSNTLELRNALASAGSLIEPDRLGWILSPELEEQR